MDITRVGIIKRIALPVSRTGALSRDTPWRTFLFYFGRRIPSNVNGNAERQIEKNGDHDSPHVTTSQPLVSSCRTAVSTRIQSYEHSDDVLSATPGSQSHLRSRGLDNVPLPGTTGTLGRSDIANVRTHPLLAQEKAKSVFDRPTITHCQRRRSAYIFQGRLSHPYRRLQLA